ncbi:MAG: tryptophan--tRNA ligase [Bacteroidales bacterium]|nr:tryptophan--tRNA ligase [Bacteroidales bacterium]
METINREIVVSGIRPTGDLHLGNYFGALRNFVKMQEQHQCFFFIADYHALTTHLNASTLHNAVKNVLVQYLAAGLDPEKSTLYIQSDLPETAELYLLLNMVAYLGELERCVSFKEKARKQPDNVNAGLLTYPVLQAADIIIHKATKVPVGKDQQQHLEMTRDFAGRFNRLFGMDYFPEPSAYNFDNDLLKIPGLDGSGKMGKSEGNAIYLVEEPEAIRKKVMRAVTDSGPTAMNSEKPEAIQNLFTLMSVVSSSDTVAFFDDAYNNCNIRYGDMKKQLAEDIVRFTTPFREKAEIYAKDDALLSKIAKMGAEKARVSAEKTVREVREIIGIRRL